MVQLASTLPANVARANFYQMLNEVGSYLRKFVITHRGKTRAIVMPIDEDKIDSWKETLEILSNKKLMKNLKQAEKERKAGKLIPLEDIERELGLA